MNKVGKKGGVMSKMIINEYTAKDLSEEEKEKFSFADKILCQILKDELLDEYLEENIQGKMTKELHKEVIKPFLSYLKERIEFVKCDYILSCIEEKSE